MSLTQFNSVPLNVPKRNKFNLSHSVKTTANMGEIIPILMHDVLPRDRYKVSLQSLIRVAPMIAPAFSEISVQFHFFFVPNRIIWYQWEDFITQAHNGKQLSEDDLPVLPTFSFGGGTFDFALDSSNFTNESDPNLGTKTMIAPLVHNSLADNLGFQTFNEKQSVSGTYELDQLPFRAYFKVWYDYFRDENLQTADHWDELFESSGRVAPTRSPSDVFLTNYMQIKFRSWKKDYFTSALPWAQKGDEVLIPVSAGGSISRIDPSAGDFVPGIGGFLSTPQSVLIRSDTDTNKSGSLVYGPSGGVQTSVDLNLENLQILSNGTASAGTIRELRRAEAAQRFLERRAIGGSRYIEQNLAFFGARSSDGRLQRAQFLGGYKMPVVVSQLLQTSQTTESSPLGTPAGNATSAGSSYIFDREFEEYGWLVGLMSIMPKADYLQGIPRKYLRKDIYDYFWPQFARIGEQPIQNQELYYDPSGGDVNTETFGYTPRYAEYRFINNRICGDFKGSLQFWTLGRSFSSTPNLNADFITCNPSTRIFAVDDSGYKHFWCDIYLSISSLRPIPKYAENL